MGFKSYREESKKGWGTDQKTALSDDQLEIGCLLRIADSLEKMEAPFKRLLDDNEYLGRRVKEQNAEIDELKRSNAALRGAITRMKKRCGGKK